MNGQINVRLPKTILSRAKEYQEQFGYPSVQALIQEALREKLFGYAQVSKRELAYLRKRAREFEGKYTREEIGI